MPKLEYIYVLKSYGRESAIYKVGYTKNIHKRIKQYKISNPLIEIAYIAELQNALTIEQEFHSSYKAVYGREWYDESMLETIIQFINERTHTQHVDLETIEKQVTSKRIPVTIDQNDISKLLRYLRASYYKTVPFGMSPIIQKIIGEQLNINKKMMPLILSKLAEQKKIFQLENQMYMLY